VAADLSAGDTVNGVGEDEGGDDVEETHQGRENTGGNDNTPEWKTQVADACSALVEIAQNVEAQDDH